MLIAIEVLLAHRSCQSTMLVKIFVCVYNIYNYSSVSVYISILKYLYFSVYIANQEFTPIPLIPVQYHRVLSSFLPFLICSPFSDNDELDSRYVATILSLLPPPHFGTLLFLLRL